MARNIEDPVVRIEPGPSGDTEVSTHPAYGQIGTSRVSGHANLYDSDFRHNAYMTITIRKSQLHRDLHRDWHFAHQEIIEVALSESQWATFVSSPNSGMGVPCTIQHMDGQIIPGLPDPSSRADQFSKEMADTLGKSIGTLKALLGQIDEQGLPKKKADAIKRAIEHALMQINSNVPFVAKSFEEHTEAVVEAAKAEIHGYMTGVLNRAGIEALGRKMPLQIDKKD